MPANSAEPLIPGDSPRSASGGLRGLLRQAIGSSWAGQFGMIWVATALLFIFSAIFAPSAASGTSLIALLPFVAILAMVAIGETLVIQQRGLDFSVAGAMSLTIVIMTKFPQQHHGSLTSAVLLCAAVGIASGVVNGIAIVVFNMPPLVATLGTNAILEGVAQGYSGGSVTSATRGLNSFMISSPLGVPVSAWFALALALVAGFAGAGTTTGRRFVAIGANSSAANAAGLRLARVQIGTYICAGLCYCLAGIVYTGYLGTPDINGGTQYLLTAISAVVIGGTALTGGRGSILATLAACLFLQQLSQVVYALGAPVSPQYIVEAGAITVSMMLRAGSVRPWRWKWPALRVQPQQP